jgi:hypothetical protein
LDDLREAAVQGMDPFSELAMTTILKRLVTPRFKERMDLRDHKDFEEAKNEVIRRASVKFQDNQDSKKTQQGKNNEMDSGFYGYDLSSGNGGEEWSLIEENEEHLMNHLVTGELMAFQVKGKGKRGQWKGGYGSKGGQAKRVSTEVISRRDSVRKEEERPVHAVANVTIVAERDIQPGIAQIWEKASEEHASPAEEKSIEQHSVWQAKEAE